MTHIFSKTLIPSVLAVAVLAGCMPAPRQAPMPVQPIAPPPIIDPVATTGIAGLQEREPDLCGTQKYTQHLSQPGSMIPTMGIPGDYMVIEFRGIEPQDYNPKRVIFRLDAAGNINQIDCG